MNDYLVNRLF